MSRGNYTSGKRQREAEKARKKREKLERRRRKREEGPGSVPIVEAEDMTGPLPSVEHVMADMQDRAANPKGAAAIPCRLFVGGLSWGTTEDDLHAAFAEFGEVTDTVIIKDRDTGRSRGFGFVTMADRKDAAKAMDALNESELDGRTIAVNVATGRGRHAALRPDSSYRYAISPCVRSSGEVHARHYTGGSRISGPRRPGA